MKSVSILALIASLGLVSGCSTGAREAPAEIAQQSSISEFVGPNKALAEIPLFENTFTLEGPRGILSVGFKSDEIVRIQFSNGQAFDEQLSAMRVELPITKIELSAYESQSDYILASDRLEVRISKSDWRISYFAPDGRLLLQESAPHSLKPKTLQRRIPDPDSYVTQITADGERQVATEFVLEPFETNVAKLSFDWSHEDEALYGLGSHEEDFLNLKGKSLRLYQHNLKMVVPFLVSTKGYGLLFDAYSSMDFDGTSNNGHIRLDAVDEVDYYFVRGEDPHEVVAGYRTLTGRAAMLPKYTFGYVQSKERYKTQDEVVAVTQEFRDRNIPLDLIVQDWRYWPEDAWSGFEWDASRYPDPAKMAADVHDLNAAIMVSIWPRIRGGQCYDEMMSQGYSLLGDTIIDSFNRKARAFYWSCAKRGMFQHGIDAFWTDGTEPVDADWPLTNRPKDFNERNIGRLNQLLGPDRTNAFGLFHAKGMYENQRSETSDKRVFTLSRSAYAGIQRYATMSWSGDVAAKWSTLRQQIPAGLNFMGAGQPYWTNDVGAFFVKTRVDAPRWFWIGDFQDGVDDLGYRELYTRWLQYAAFLPMFRSHGTDTPREPWQFGEPGTLFYDAIVDAINLRYEFLPYTYSLAGDVVHRHGTMAYPLAFDFPSDALVHDLKDQFMFGPALMVAPVTEPMYYNPNSIAIEQSDKTQEVYLPEGTDWYDYWDKKRFKGGQVVSVDAPLKTIPLFVRSGSILPTGPDIQYTGENPDAPIDITVYAGNDGAFVLYDDEGNNYAYEDGHYSAISLVWSDNLQELTFLSQEGSYKLGEPQVFKIKCIGCSESSIPQTITYRGIESTVTFRDLDSERRNVK